MIALNSCKPDGQDPDATLTFSTLTVEQQKQSVEQNGLDFVTKMDGMQKTQGFIALTQLANLNGAMATPIAQLRTSLVKNDVKAMENFNKQMRVASGNAGDSIWGEWTWNKTNKEFQKTAVLINKAILHFPADSASASTSTNNATLTVIYVESNVIVPDVDPVQYMPASLSVILKVGTTEALNAQFVGTYNNDATPTMLKQTLVIGNYNWSADYTNNKTDVSVIYAFKYDTQILLKYALGAKGSLTATQIQAAMNDSTNRPQDVITSGYMSLQVMNIAVYGGITDTKGFADEGNALKPDSIVHHDIYYDYTEYIYPKSYRDKEVVIFNKYLKFYGYFVAENAKFADVEFYTAEGQEPDYSKQGTLVYTTTSTNYYPPAVTVKYDYYDYDYNYNTGVYTYTFYAYPTKTVYNAQPRFVLSDGSKITDFNKYANDNFTTLIDKLNSLNSVK